MPSTDFAIQTLGNTIVSQEKDLISFESNDFSPVPGMYTWFAPEVNITLPDLVEGSILYLATNWTQRSIIDPPPVWDSGLADIVNPLPVVGNEKIELWADPLGEINSGNPAWVVVSTANIENEGIGVMAVGSTFIVN